MPKKPPKTPAVAVPDGPPDLNAGAVRKTYAARKNGSKVWIRMCQGIVLDTRPQHPPLRPCGERVDADATYCAVHGHEARRQDALRAVLAPDWSKRVVGEGAKWKALPTLPTKNADLPPLGAPPELPPDEPRRTRPAAAAVAPAAQPAPAAPRPLATSTPRETVKGLLGSSLLNR